MNFRRQPFQFTAIDPAKRHEELQKRFGLPANDMYVDCVNPSLMGAVREPSVGGSPRLQHRVPMFTEGCKPTKLSNPQNNVDSEHKPRVRVIPIQVEGVDGPAKRHRTLSGPAGPVNCKEIPNDVPELLQANMKPSNSFHANRTVNKPSQPKVCNIPIHIESKGEKKKEPVIPKSNVQKQESAKKLKSTEMNGCVASKSEEKPKEPDVSVPLKQIENVLNRFKKYQEEVEKFSGTGKDKQYRYLDEMLTRCMLDLDNVDTMGIDCVRQSRKAAVRQVQACIDLLENKVNTQSAALRASEGPAVTDKKDVPEDTEMADASQQSADENTTVESDSGVMEVCERAVQDNTDDVEMHEAGEQTCENEGGSQSAEQESVHLMKSPEEEAVNSMEVSAEPDTVVDSQVEEKSNSILPQSSDKVEERLGEERSCVVVEEIDESTAVETTNKIPEVIDSVLGLEPIVTEPTDSCEASELNDSKFDNIPFEDVRENKLESTNTDKPNESESSSISNKVKEQEISVSEVACDETVTVRVTGPSTVQKDS